MRTPDLLIARQTGTRLEQARSASQKAQNVALSGLAHTSAAESSSWYSTLQRTDSEQRLFARGEKTLNEAERRLLGSEDSLAAVSEVLQELSEHATQGASDLLSAENRRALAVSVRSLKSTALKIANTRDVSGYLFAGTQSGTAPFDTNGVFVGDSSVASLDVGDDSVSTGVDASSVFSPAGGVDIFAMFDTLANALDANDGATVRANIDNVSAAVEQVSAGRSRLGDHLDVVTRMRDVIDNKKQRTAEERVASVEVDPIAAYSEIARTQSALEAALKVSAQSLQLSLADYL